ncbi:MAG: hypothetical protein ABSA32_02185 [Candidatus Acidiferrales bacterium]|jgi:hypothetical protein
MRFPLQFHKRKLLAASALLVSVAMMGAVRGAAQDVAPEETSPPTTLEFHSGFWVNLHLFLYEQSRIALGDVPANAQAGTAGQSAASALSPAERQTWNAAVAYYAGDLGHRDLTTSLDFARISDRLGELETCADLSGRSKQACTSGLRADEIRVLESAAPIYRAHWWPQHDRANRAWIALAAPLVAQMGADLANRLSAIYQQNWPRGRLRVDVTCYAGSEGAYTTLDPPHVVIASQDARNQGLYGFEELFHQASKVLAGGVMNKIAELCRGRDIPIPRDLGTALLYYTTGYAMQRELAEIRPNDPPYTPYAERFGLYQGPWSQFDALLEEYWRPYLDGRLEFDSAIEHVVAGIS